VGRNALPGTLWTPEARAGAESGLEVTSSVPEGARHFHLEAPRLRKNPCPLGRPCRRQTGAGAQERGVSHVAMETDAA
jgi:hypothetical protein